MKAIIVMKKYNLGLTVDYNNQKNFLGLEIVPVLSGYHQFHNKQDRRYSDPKARNG